MIYTIEKAMLVRKQLQRFTTGYTYQVAGHFANVEFWLNEVKESLKTIDEHSERFNRIKDTQLQWVKDHGTEVFDYCAICGGKYELGNGIPPTPTSKYKVELKEARKNIVDAAYYFLTRCYRIGLLEMPDLREKCDEIGTSIDPSDLNRKTTL